MLLFVHWVHVPMMLFQASFSLHPYPSVLLHMTMLTWHTSSLPQETRSKGCFINSSYLRLPSHILLQTYSETKEILQLWSEMYNIIIAEKSKNAANCNTEKRQLFHSQELRILDHRNIYLNRFTNLLMQILAQSSFQLYLHHKGFLLVYCLNGCFFSQFK